MSVCLPEEFERNVLGYGKCKWAPGQRLNSAAEVMQALLDGQILNQGFKPFHMRKDGKFYFLDDNEPIAVHLSSKNLDETHIYTPPKRKVKSERWFAVFQNDYDTDGVSWSGPYSSKTEVGIHYPNALAYVKAECEVEVDE
jgi:hypothetical protein